MTDDSTNGPAERTVREARTLSPMRRTIAERLRESVENAVHITVSRDVDAEALVSASTAAGDDVTITDVLLRALSDSLDDHPEFNATFEDDTHRLYEEHNVGVAVDLDEGLVTPVVADVGSKSLSEVATARRRLTERVQAGDYTMSDFRGGTFTVSNLGPFGVSSFTPVINPPEVAVLGVNQVQERAVRGNGGVTFRRQLTLDLSVDHRVVDGADAARFLRTLDEHLGRAEHYLDG